MRLSKITIEKIVEGGIMRVQWYEFDGLDVAIDPRGRQWLAIAQAQFAGRTIVRARCYQSGKGLMVGKIVDCLLVSVIACTEADLALIEREGAAGIIAAARADRRSSQRRLHPHRVR